MGEQMNSLISASRVSWQSLRRAKVLLRSDGIYTQDWDDCCRNCAPGEHASNNQL